MGYESSYAAQEPSRAEVDALPGPTLVEFGAPWCGYCQAAQADIAAALAQRPGLRHLKIEDGRGRPLGRSFRVKLWPTLVLVEAGVEVGRRVRPHDADEIAGLLTVPTG
jgi:thioredoxin 1